MIVLYSAKEISAFILPLAKAITIFRSIMHWITVIPAARFNYLLKVFVCLPINCHELRYHKTSHNDANYQLHNISNVCTIWSRSQTSPFACRRIVVTSFSLSLSFSGLHNVFSNFNFHLKLYTQLHFFAFAVPGARCMPAVHNSCNFSRSKKHY